MSPKRCVTLGLPQPSLSLSFLLSTRERYSTRDKAVGRQRARDREVRVLVRRVGRRWVRLQLLPPLQLAVLQCEVAALRKEHKVLSGIVESLSTQNRALMEQQHQLRGQLEELNSRFGGG